MPVFLLAWLRSSRLTSAEKAVLRALMEGSTLKSQRTLHGQKHYRLHPLAREPEKIDAAVIDRLTARGLLLSNQKFPVATFLLTERGRSVARRLLPGHDNPLGATNFR